MLSKLTQKLKKSHIEVTIIKYIVIIECCKLNIYFLFQATAEQIRYAKLAQAPGLEENKIQEKIKEVCILKLFCYYVHYMLNCFSRYQLMLKSMSGSNSKE